MTNSPEITSQEVYDFFLLFRSLDTIKQAFMMVLLHTYPKTLTTKQLVTLAGYSKNSKHVFRSGILEALELERLITIQKPTKKLFLITINPEHSVLLKFNQVCEQYGKFFQEEIFGKLLEE